MRGLALEGWLLGLEFNEAVSWSLLSWLWVSWCISMSCAYLSSSELNFLSFELFFVEGCSSEVMGVGLCRRLLSPEGFSDLLSKED